MREKGEIRIELINGLQDHDWDRFVDESNNGTIFHKLKFLSYHKDSSINWHNLKFCRNGSLLAVLPGAIINNEFRSPFCASYGGFVLRSAVFADYVLLLDAFLKYCIEKGIHEVYLTLPPSFYFQKKNEILEFVLRYKGFILQKSLITNASDLGVFSENKDDEEFLRHFPSSSRSQIRQSLQYAFQIEINEDYEGFYPILLDNKKKFASSPTHTLEDLKRLQELFPENIKLFMAYEGAQKMPAAGVLVFVCNAGTALCFYISQYYEFQQKRVVNRLLFEIIKWCKRQNLRYLDLGVSVDTSHDNPMEPVRTLIYFKEKAAASCGYLRSTYYKRIS